MSDIDVRDMIGPSVIMPGSNIGLEEAMLLAEERFPGHSFCIVDDWVWLDLEAPDLVTEELVSEGKQLVMLLVFNELYDSSTTSKTYWFQSTPLVEFTEGMFFKTAHKIYVLLGHGRRKKMSLSAVVRLF